MMTEQPARRSSPWNGAWNLAVGNRSLAVVLVGLMLLITLVLVVPQTPSSPPAASRWLAETQARFGPAMPFLEAVGLLSISRSPLFRTLLCLLAFLLLVRGSERVLALAGRGRGIGGAPEAWRPLREEDLERVAQRLRRSGHRVRWSEDGSLQADRWPWAEALDLLSHAGVLLLLVGSLVGTVWGWRAGHLTGRPGEVIDVPGHGQVTVAEGASSGHAATSSGARLYPEGSGPELAVTATDDSGQALDLLRTPDEEPSQQIHLRLADTAPDAYFAIPEAALFVRVALDPEAALDAATPVLVQVFRIRSGELVQEAIATGDEHVIQGETNIRLVRARYLIFTAARDPGFGMKVVGLAMAGLALLGQALWPVRRLGVRQGSSELEGFGDLPGDLVQTEGQERPLGSGRRAARLITGLLAPVVGGAALWSLTRSGLLWDGSTAQVGLTALWALGTAAYLAWPGRRAGGRGSEGE
jgi:hypothetical protein